MHIEMNLTSRHVCAFDLPVEKPKELLNQIKPRDFFQRPLHQFLGKAMTVSINPEMIEWILLDTQDIPDTKPLNRSVTIQQIPEEAFQEQVSAQEGLVSSLEPNEMSGQKALMAYGKAIFTSGHILCLEIHAELDQTTDRMDLSQKIFEMPALFVKENHSKLLIVNPKNIAVWQVVPGLRKSGRFSMQAELVGISSAD